MTKAISLFAVAVLQLMLVHPVLAQNKSKKQSANTPDELFDAEKFSALQWRNVGPFRGGRAVAATGVPGDPLN